MTVISFVKDRVKFVHIQVLGGCGVYVIEFGYYSKLWVWTKDAHLIQLRELKY